jgi:type IV secretory pathway TraG/TraD family ATPase VirD4
MNRRPAGWPSPVMWATLCAGVVSLLLTVGMVWLDYARSWSFLEKYYVPMYVATLKADINPLPHSPAGKYRLIEVVDGKNKQRIALPGEVEPQAGPDGKIVSYVLTELGQQRGLVRLVWLEDNFEHKTLRAFLGSTIYQNKGVWGYISRSVYYGAAIFALFLFVTVPKDRKRTRVLREGKQLQGPEQVSVEEFNARNKSDGIGFWVEPRNLWEKIRRRRVSVHIPRKQEAHHIMIMGDTGAGKSSRIRELLMEIEGRGEGAIVHDPSLEYTPQFYRPERGDIILNPLDQRMPYWSPCDEVEHEAEAATIAASLFPDSERMGNDFCVKGPRRIFARLLMLKLPPEELVRVMADEKELDRIAKGTDLESLLYHGAGPQRGGVMGELNMVVDGLKLLPRREETKAAWTATQWSKQRKGWLFLTSTPETREAVLPLTSLWLDMLVLRLMNRQEERPVWFVLDELDTLKRLPQLHNAVTQTRKSGNPVVLGFQGRSQVEARYGHIAESLLSQPSTKIFLRTGEPNAARWVSSYIGDEERQWLRVSYTEGQTPQQRRSKTWHTEQPPARPLVIASTIQGLTDHQGYMKLDNLLVKVKFSYSEPAKNQPGFLLRRKAAPADAEPASSPVKPHFD